MINRECASRVRRGVIGMSAAVTRWQSQQNDSGYPAEVLHSAE